jgi:hypothetical protein
MADVYNKASMVCIWLGNGNEQREAAVEFVEVIINLPKLDKIVEDCCLIHQCNVFAHLLKSRWFSER